MPLRGLLPNPFDFNPPKFHHCIILRLLIIADEVIFTTRTFLSEPMIFKTQISQRLLYLEQIFFYQRVARQKMHLLVHSLWL